MVTQTVAIYDSGEYSTMVSAWHDCVYLTRRANGTFTVKMHRRPVGDPGYAYLFRSRPFRTGKALLDALKEAEPQSTYESFDGDMDSLLDAAETLDATLAQEARALLAACDWAEWKSGQVQSVPMRRLD